MFGSYESLLWQRLFKFEQFDCGGLQRAMCYHDRYTLQSDVKVLAVCFILKILCDREHYFCGGSQAV